MIWLTILSQDELDFKWYISKYDLMIFKIWLLKQIKKQNFLI